MIDSKKNYKFDLGVKGLTEQMEQRRCVMDKTDFCINPKWRK